MSDIEELKAELEALKKANLEREIALEKAKVEEAAKLEEEKKKQEIYDEIKAQVIKDMEGTSVVSVDEEPTIILNDFDKYVYEPFYKRYGIPKTEGATLEERYEKRLELARNKEPRNRGLF